VSTPKPNPAASLRIFCFPYAGVGASAYRMWLTAFPPDVEVCVVQPPGRESRFGEPSFTDVGALADAAADALVPHLALPFVFFGHSLGALTAFEVTRRLRARGETGPLRLFVSSHRAPQLPNPHPNMHGLPDTALIDAVCRAYDGIPRIVLDTPELLAIMLPALRADLTAFETYRYTEAAPLPCPISVFGGAADRRVSRSDLEGWTRQTTGAFALRLLDGGHFYLQAHRDAVVTAIREDLAAVAAALPAGLAG
jgi:medium-chain acyl-[acyl-carrier-protein] hydrolase